MTIVIGRERGQIDDTTVVRERTAEPQRRSYFRRGPSRPDESTRLKIIATATCAALVIWIAAIFVQITFNISWLSSFIAMSTLTAIAFIYARPIDPLRLAIASSGTIFIIIATRGLGGSGLNFTASTGCSDSPESACSSNIELALNELGWNTMLMIIVLCIATVAIVWVAGEKMTVEKTETTENTSESSQS